MNWTRFQLFVLVALISVAVGGNASGMQFSEDSPAKYGEWHEVMDWPLEAIHAIHLRPTSNDQKIGKILIFAGGSNPSPHLWNPVTNKLTETDSVASEIFCAGHSHLADGTPLVVGGLFIPDTNIFDAHLEQWFRVADMSYGRFYPTCTTLPKGAVLATSGGPDFLEVYRPEADEWMTLPDSAAISLPFYPTMFLLPSGGVAVTGATAGQQTETLVLNLNTYSWTSVTSNSFAAGSAAMYMPGRVLAAGSPAFFTPTAKSAVINFNSFLNPVWEAVNPMHNARTNHDLTILADGTVLAVGGTNEVGQDVLEAEMYFPEDKAWKRMASMNNPRNYHSVTILLGDGRVLAAGGFHPYTAQVYSPPYLYWGPRPQITYAPKSTGYGDVFKIETGEGQATDIKKVALVGLGAVTHSFDQNQRYVPVKFEVADDQTLVLYAPGKATVAPPGVYMLFIINSEGIPSIARYVRID